MNVALNALNIKQNIARNVQRCVIIAQKSAEEWQELLHRGLAKLLR
jgi:hypothetical protein